MHAFKWTKHLAAASLRAPRWLGSAGLLATLLLPTAVLADSDGYFCAGKGYLAYQFNGLSVPEVGHYLYLIKLDADAGMGEPHRIPLDAFQVHGMRCLSDTVDLMAWNRIYRVELDGQSPESISMVEPQPEDSELPDFSSNNLGGWATDSRTQALKTASGRYRFELIIEKGEKIRSLLRQLGPKKENRELLLFSGRPHGAPD